MSAPREIELGRQERQWGSALQAGAEDGCTSAEDLLRFVEGVLPAELRAGVLRHLAHCEGCQEVVLQLRATERVLGRRRGSWVAHLLTPVGGRSLPTTFAMGAGLALGTLALAGVVVVTTRHLHSQTPERGPAIVALNDPHPADTGSPPPPTYVDPRKDARTSAGSTPVPHGIGSSGHPETNVSQRPAPHSDNPATGRGDARNAQSSRPTMPSVPHAGAPNRREGTMRSANSRNGNSSAPVGGGTKPASAPPPNPPTDGLAVSHEYCLVGAHHAYTLESPEQSQSQRMDIETQYADKVADAEQTYKQEVDAQADADEAQKELTEHVEAAAAERDQKLAAICGNDDSLLTAHPELRLDFEGPYQLVRIDYRRRGDTKVIEACQVLPAWPGYDQYVPEPYGWAYHRSFTYEEFVRARHEWIARVGSPERHAFWGLVGHEGPIPVTIVREDGHGYGLYGSHYGTSRYGSIPNYGSAPRYGSSPRYSESGPRYGAEPGRQYGPPGYGTPRSGTSTPYGRPSVPVRRYGSSGTYDGSKRDPGYGGSSFGDSVSAGSYGGRRLNGGSSERPGGSYLGKPSAYGTSSHEGTSIGGYGRGRSGYGGRGSGRRGH